MFRWKLEKMDSSRWKWRARRRARFRAGGARNGHAEHGAHPSRTAFLNLTGYNYTLQFPAGDYLIDKCEVTNKQFKAFVDAGGYAKREYWAQQFERDGRAIPWTEAMAILRDRTGRPGPSTWDVGRYPAGQDDFPVSGVSWYEADAFARFSGRSLPSVYHWVGAAGIGQAAYVTPLSNLTGKGPSAVGSFAGLTAGGAFDMAGNVKEWCANAVAGTNERYLLGGSWADPPYAFTHADARAPFDRSEENGFRLATYLDKSLRRVHGSVAVSRRDYTAERPVPDQVFAAYRALSTIRGRSTPRSKRATTAIRIGSESASASARRTATSECRRTVSTEEQTTALWGIVYMPGASMLAGNSANLRDTLNYDYAVVSGRAVLYPSTQAPTNATRARPPVAAETRL